MESCEGAPTFGIQTKHAKYPEPTIPKVGVIWADAFESPIYGYSHLPPLKQNKIKKPRDCRINIFSTGANTTRQKVSTCRRSVGIFAEKFYLQQSSCVLRHSGTYHTSTVLSAKKPAPCMEVRGNL